MQIRGLGKPMWTGWIGKRRNPDSQESVFFTRQVCIHSIPRTQASGILQMLVWRFCAWLSWSGCIRWNLCLLTWFQYTIMGFASSPFTWLSSVRWLRLITLSWPAVFTSTTCHWASIKRRPLRESTIYRTGLRVTTFSFFGDSFAWLSAKRCRWIVTTSRFFLHSTPAWLVTLTEHTPLSKLSIYRTHL